MPRGRPKKNPEAEAVPAVRRPRGRPRKDAATAGQPPAKGRGPQSIDCSKISPELMSLIITDCASQIKQPMVKTDEECLQRLSDFFAHYAESGGLPTVEKMCLWLGAPKSTVFDWQQGKKGEKRAAIIKRAKNILAAIDADLAMRGLIRDAVYIFRAKNYYGMKDQQDVVVQAKNLLGPDVDRAEIERRLSENVIIDGEYTTATETETEK